MGPASGNPFVPQFNCSVVTMQKTKCTSGMFCLLEKTLQKIVAVDIMLNKRLYL